VGDPRQVSAKNEECSEGRTGLFINTDERWWWNLDKLESLAHKTTLSNLCPIRRELISQSRGRRNDCCLILTSLANSSRKAGGNIGSFRDSIEMRTVSRNGGFHWYAHREKDCFKFVRLITQYGNRRKIIWGKSICTVRQK